MALKTSTPGTAGDGTVDIGQTSGAYGVRSMYSVQGTALSGHGGTRILFA